MEDLKAENKLLRQKVDLLVKKVFGASSEKLDSNQPDLFLVQQPESTLGKTPASSEIAEEEAKPQPRKRNPVRKERWPEDLPVVVEVLDPAEVTAEPEQWRCIGQEISERRLPVAALTREQMSQLFAVPNVTDPLGLRDRAILELFYSSGIRRTELCKIELPQLHLERRTLHIRQGKGKKDRFVPIGEHALYWLERYLSESRPQLKLNTRSDALFLTSYGGPFHPDVLSRLVSQWMADAGIKGSCHLLRHTCASHMLEGGADIRYIQQLLGHEDLKTTAIYTEVNIRQLQEVHARCHPSSQRDAGPRQRDVASSSIAALAAVPQTR